MNSKQAASLHFPLREALMKHRERGNLRSLDCAELPRNRHFCSARDEEVGLIGVSLTLVTPVRRDQQ